MSCPVDFARSLSDLLVAGDAGRWMKPAVVRRRPSPTASYSQRGAGRRGLPLGGHATPDRAADATESDNPREIGVLAVVLADRPIASGSMRYCDYALREFDRLTKAAQLTKRAPLGGDSETRTSERPGRCDLGKPTGSPGKLERGAFPQYWLFPPSPCRRAVNRKDREFVVGLFGSPNGTRTYDLLVDGGETSEKPSLRAHRASGGYPTLSVDPVGALPAFRLEGLDGVTGFLHGAGHESANGVFLPPHLLHDLRERVAPFLRSASQ